MRKRMRTVNQTQCCFMLVFHKLTVPLQAPFRPRAHTDTHRQTVENPPVSAPLLHFACSTLLVCQDFCMCVSVCLLTLLRRKKKKKKKGKTCFASYLSKRGHTDSTPTRRLGVKAKFEFNTAQTCWLQVTQISGETASSSQTGFVHILKVSGQTVSLSKSKELFQTVVALITSGSMQTQVKHLAL